MSAAMSVTVTPTPDGVYVELWCPAFVDHTDEGTAQEALEWAQRRLGDTDPFEEYPR